jgi:putative transposase
VYLAFILDTHSRRIVGWAMENHMRTDLVVDALSDGGLEAQTIRRTRSSFRPRRPVEGDLVWQAPCGGQHRPLDGKDRNGPGQSAIAESFIATLKTELVHRRRFPDREWRGVPSSSTWRGSTTDVGSSRL